MKISKEDDIISKIRIKPSKLKKNEEVEEVWIFSDDSFINLFYKIFTSESLVYNFSSLTSRETKSRLNKFIDDSNKENIKKKPKNNLFDDSISSKSMFKNYEILESNLKVNDPENKYSREYISKLDFNEIEYDTFCHCFFISGLKNDNLELIEKSEEYPSPCLHKECSILSSFQPSILQYYQNPNKKYQIEISDLTANLVFPLGIKICFNFDTNSIYPKPYNTFLNILRNQKGDIYFLVSLHYFRKMNMIDFEKHYKINPLKEFTKFKNVNETNFDDKKFENKLEIITQFIDNETIFIPECMTLVSRFPFINQMENCLKTMINLNSDDLNNLINHLTNEIPVPFRNQKILFYIPHNLSFFQLVCPFRPSTVNFKACNILKYLSIENIIKIFELILLEQKILFIHNDYQLLSLISFTFYNLIYPFNWVNPYIPVLSLNSVQFLQSIIPFIMGTDEFLFNYSINNEFISNNNENNIIFIDIDHDKITLNIQNVLKKNYLFSKDVIKELKLPELPEKIKKFLKQELKVIKKKHNEFNVVENIKEIFLKAFVRMFGNFYEFIFMTNDMPIFNSESFLSTKKDGKNFYKEIIQTQIFNQFILNENDIIKRKRDKIKTTLIEPYGKKYDNLLIDTSLFNIKVRQYINQDDNYFFHTIKTRARSNKNKKSEKNKKHLKEQSSFHLETSKNENSNSSSHSKGFFTSRKNDYLSIDTFNSGKTNVNPYIHTTTLIFPYFIDSPMISIDRDQIENYIEKEISKNNKKIFKNKKIPKYIIDGNKTFNLKQIKDIYRRYFFNVTEEKGIKKIKTLKRKSLSTTNLVSLTQIDEIQKIKEWFYIICNEEFEIKKLKIDNINDLMKKQKNREYFANLISQGYSFNDRFKKSLLNRSYNEMVKIIILIFEYVSKNEYNVIKSITIAIFSYFTYDSQLKKFKYIFEEIINLNCPCRFWKESEFWKNWYVNDLETGEVYIFDDVIENESIFPYSLKLLIQLFSFMKNLKLDITFINNVIFDDLGINYLKNDERIQLKEEIEKI